MSLYSLLLTIDLLLVFLPLCLSSKAGTLFFSTQSSRLWSRSHRRWSLPPQQVNEPLRSNSALASSSSHTYHLAVASNSSDPRDVAMASNISNPDHLLAMAFNSSNPNRHATAVISSNPGISNSRRNGTCLDEILSKQKQDKLNDQLAMDGRHGSNLDGPAMRPKTRRYSTGEDDGLTPRHFSKAHGMIGYARLILQKGKEGARAAGLIAWLLVLLYLLGTTASDYFSCTLEKLSEVLNLSPAVAGVTLLAIGNGAPDVFSSVAAFASSDSTESVGFSLVLGGVLFVTTVVSGTVALVTARACRKETLDPVFIIEEGTGTVRRENDSTSACREDGQAGVCREEGPARVRSKEEGAAADGFVRIDLICFVRDALFLLVSVGILTMILLDGKVYLWEAISFLCVYAVYAVFVWAGELLKKRNGQSRSNSLLDPLLIKATEESSLPQWADVYQAQEHPHYHVHSQQLEAEVERLWENQNEHSFGAKLKHWLLLFYKYCIQWPLALPRRLTIPIVEEGRWSRPVAITSCILAPLFVAGVWAFRYSDSTTSRLLILGIGGGLGILLGLLAFFNTDNARQPERCLWLWLAGGFLMSIVWFYLVADALVTSLESLGTLFSIRPAILGFTLLAWGNSVGDLVADVALACNGRDGVQIAISGCYAGPLFNTVVGLGLSLVVGCWRSSPEPLLLASNDATLYYVIGFLAAALAWALVIMPLKGMRLSRSFGLVLILLYGSFLVTGLCYLMGWIS